MTHFMKSPASARTSPPCCSCEQSLCPQHRLCAPAERIAQDLRAGRALARAHASQGNCNAPATQAALRKHSLLRWATKRSAFGTIKATAPTSSANSKTAAPSSWNPGSPAVRSIQHAITNLIRRINLHHESRRGRQPGSAPCLAHPGSPAIPPAPPHRLRFPPAP